VRLAGHRLPYAAKTGAEIGFAVTRTGQYAFLTEVVKLKCPRAWIVNAYRLSYIIIPLFYNH
jgi:hypothetical protein